jgi:hypothetical protein
MQQHETIAMFMHAVSRNCDYRATGVAMAHDQCILDGKAAQAVRREAKTRPSAPE